MARERVAYPSVWGEGAMFAPSGLDVATDHARPCIGSLLGDALGMRLHTLDHKGDFAPNAVELRADVPGLTPGSCDRARSIVAGDVLDLRAADLRWAVLALAHGVFLVRVEAPAGLSWSFSVAPAQSAAVVCDRDAVTLAEEGNVLAARAGGGDALLAVAVRNAVAGDPETLARNALTKDFDAEVRERLSFFSGLDVAWLPADVAETYAKAASVLRLNVESPQGRIPCRWTTPDKFPHRHMWIWDSAFHALGWARLDHQMAVDALAAVFSWQRDDGFIPITMQPERTQELHSQPPILGWAAEHVLGISEGAAAVWEAFYPALARFVRWILANRPGTGRGLPGWLKEEGSSTCRCGESGLDNAAQYDHPGPDDCVDLVSFVVRELETLAKVAALLGRGAEAAEWDELRARLANAANEALWSEEHGLYLNRDREGRLVEVKAQASFFPLYAGIPTPDRAKRMAETLRGNAFQRPLPVPSLSADHPEYGRNMWRGPTWMNTNLLIAEGLRRYGFEDAARQLARRSVDEAARWYRKIGVLMEYYDAEAEWDPRFLHRKDSHRGGTPVARDYAEAAASCRGVIRDYGWTAAVLIVFIRDYICREG